jgi:hypothetical protein
MFRVVVDDNFHAMDANERTEHGHFQSYEQAVVAARAIVDAFLTLHHTPGMSADQLFALYTSFGDDPFSVPAAPESPVSAWAYAGQRCAALCGDTTAR